MKADKPFEWVWLGYTTARKAQRCDACGFRIEKGDPCLRDCSQWRNGFVCTACSDVYAFRIGWLSAGMLPSSPEKLDVLPIMEVDAAIEFYRHCVANYLAPLGCCPYLLIVQPAALEELIERMAIQVIHWKRRCIQSEIAELGSSLANDPRSVGWQDVAHRLVDLFWEDVELRRQLFSKGVSFGEH